MQTKYFALLAQLASLAYSGPVPAAEAELDALFHSKRASTYTFNVYQVAGCTGEATTIDGTGAADCTGGDILNGGGLSFIATYLQSGYTVYLYESEDDCTADASHEDYLDKIDSDTTLNMCYAESEDIGAYTVVKN